MEIITFSVIRYLTLLEVLELHRQIIEQPSGKVGIRDLGLWL
jgi:death-on-curing protein